MAWPCSLPSAMGGSRVTLQDDEAPIGLSAYSLTSDLSLLLSDYKVDSDLGRR